jgi:hypothetical protein
MCPKDQQLQAATQPWRHLPGANWVWDWQAQSCILMELVNATLKRLGALLSGALRQLFCGELFREVFQAGFGREMRS